MAGQHDDADDYGRHRSSLSGAAVSGRQGRSAQGGPAGKTQAGAPCPSCSTPLDYRGPFDGREPESGVPAGHEGFGETYLCGNAEQPHWWADINGSLIPASHVLTVVQAALRDTGPGRAAQAGQVAHAPAHAGADRAQAGTVAGLDVFGGSPCSGAGGPGRRAGPRTGRGSAARPARAARRGRS